METTDDDFDFGSDLEDVAASVPAAGLPRAQRTKASNNKKKRPNGAGLDPKKVTTQESHAALYQSCHADDKSSLFPFHHRDLVVERVLSTLTIPTVNMRTFRKLQR